MSAVGSKEEYSSWDCMFAVKRINDVRMYI
jgi:hypothetical protein